MGTRAKIWGVGLSLAAGLALASLSATSGMLRWSNKDLYIAGTCTDPAHSRLVFVSEDGTAAAFPTGPLLVGDCLRIVADARSNFRHCCSESVVPEDIAASCTAPRALEPGESLTCLRHILMP